MRETDFDVHVLSQLIARSNEQAGRFLKNSFEIPDRTLTAEQLIQKLDGAVTLVLGTVTSVGKPRTAPVIALFYRGRFHIPTVRSALRTRHVLNNPDVSLSLYEGNDFAVIVHGTAAIVDPSNPEFTELVELQREHAGSDVREWGDPLFLRIDPSHVFSFARYPEQFSETSLAARTT